jgi:hypothetical protein
MLYWGLFEVLYMLNIIPGLYETSLIRRNPKFVGCQEVKGKVSWSRMDMEER